MEKNLKPVEAYCLKCKKKQLMMNMKLVSMKNNRPALTGHCEQCNTTLFKILKKDEKPEA